MSIIIKGMEMPKDGTAEAIVIHSDGAVGFLHEDDYRKLTAVPVPPHGDLIDYDFCMENYELLHDDDGNPVYAVRMSDINIAPTIIPADHIDDGNEMAKPSKRDKAIQRLKDIGVLNEAGKVVEPYDKIFVPAEDGE